MFLIQRGKQRGGGCKSNRRQRNTQGRVNVSHRATERETGKSRIKEKIDSREKGRKRYGEKNRVTEMDTK